MSSKKVTEKKKAWNNGCGAPGRGGVYVKELTKVERELVNNISTPWRDAGANVKLLPSQVPPHQCRIITFERKIKGSIVKVEIRK